MATVYEAIDDTLGRRVALKVLASHLAHDQAFVARFRTEAQAVAALSHPGIVTVYEVGHDGDSHYIAMQYLESDLAGRIETEGPLPVDVVVSVAAQVAAGLEAAHAQGIVHRDVKPSNIMFDSSGHARLVDFGIVRVLEGTKLTRMGMSVGTPEYMSPEQAAGGAVDHRTDIYSLGIVMHEMLTGRAPFTASTPLAVAYMHRNETMPDVRALRPDVPEWLALAIQCCVSKEPQDRWSSCADLVQALASRTVAARPLWRTPGPQAAAAGTYEPAAVRAGLTNPRAPLLLIVIALALVGIAAAIAAVTFYPGAWQKVLAIADGHPVRTESNPGPESGPHPPPPPSESGTPTQPDDTPGEAPQVRVPDLRGMLEDAAYDTAGREGLNAERTYDQTGQVKPHIVIDHDPPGGKDVPRGTTIRLRIAWPLSTPPPAPPPPPARKPKPPSRTTPRDFTPIVADSLLLGAWGGGRWLKPEEASGCLRGGETYRCFTLYGDKGRRSGGKPEEGPVGGPIVDLGPNGAGGSDTAYEDGCLLAVGGRGDLRPRQPERHPLSDPLLERAAGAVLRKKGVFSATPRIVQSVQVDLEGDGPEEILFAAAWPWPHGDPGHVEDKAPGYYSFVAVVPARGDANDARLVCGDFGKNLWSHAVGGLLDVDGDGQLEVIVKRWYYEGDGATLFDPEGGQMREGPVKNDRGA
jgi:hypothetical protein